MTRSMPGLLVGNCLCASPSITQAAPAFAYLFGCIGGEADLRLQLDAGGSINGNENEASGMHAC